VRCGLSFRARKKARCARDRCALGTGLWTPGGGVGPVRHPPVMEFLGTVADLPTEHFGPFADLQPASAWPARGAHQGHPEYLGRHRPMQPASVFAYLALLALDLERLDDPGGEDAVRCGMAGKSREKVPAPARYCEPRLIGGC
jgi:hypothetical protein